MRQDWLSRYEASDAAALLAALPATPQRSAGVGRQKIMRCLTLTRSMHRCVSRRLVKESNCGQCALVSTTGCSVQISQKAPCGSVGGNKKAVLLDYSLWEELLSQLENLEDAEEIRHLGEAEEAVISWEQAKGELRAEGVDV